MSYTTTAKIRDDSGFNNNTYILDTSIDAQRIRAFGVINSYVGIRYQLPNTSDSNFIGSSAASLLESVEIMLGGGYLLIKEYGPEGRDSDKDGYRRVKDAEQILSDIRENKIALYGTNGSILPSVLIENSVSGKPRSFPGVTADDSYDRRFSVTDRF